MFDARPHLDAIYHAFGVEVQRAGKASFMGRLQQPGSDILGGAAMADACTLRYITATAADLVPGEAVTLNATAYRVESTPMATPGGLESQVSLSAQPTPAV